MRGTALFGGARRLNSVDVCAQPVVDMTPSKGEVRELLGGQVTISGLYEQVGSANLNVVVRAWSKCRPVARNLNITAYRGRFCVRRS